MKKAMTETSLITPSLVALMKIGGWVDTSTLRKELKKRIPLHKADVQKVDKNTIRFDKTVNNLVSHRTLMPFVKYRKNDKGRIEMRIRHTGVQHVYTALNQL